MDVSLFLLILCTVTAVRSQCHADWHVHGESCYAFSELLFTWTDAQEMCRSFGAKLAEIETAEENNYIKATAQTLGRPFFWIGGSDVFHEGNWVWVSTSEPFYPFSDWYPGRPEGGAAQGCLLLDKSLGYTWNDGGCTNSNYFICERGLQETVVG